MCTFASAPAGTYETRKGHTAPAMHNRITYAAAMHKRRVSSAFCKHTATRDFCKAFTRLHAPVESRHCWRCCCFWLRFVSTSLFLGLYLFHSVKGGADVLREHRVDQVVGFRFASAATAAAAAADVSAFANGRKGNARTYVWKLCLSSVLWRKYNVRASTMVSWRGAEERAFSRIYSMGVYTICRYNPYSDTLA